MILFVIGPTVQPFPTLLYRPQRAKLIYSRWLRILIRIIFHFMIFLSQAPLCTLPGTDTVKKRNVLFVTFVSYLCLSPLFAAFTIIINHVKYLHNFTFGFELCLSPFCVTYVCYLCLSPLFATFSLLPSLLVSITLSTYIILPLFLYCVCRLCLSPFYVTFACHLCLLPSL